VMVRPITPTHPACYGVMCERHSQCQRYDLVEQTSADDTIATCDDGRAGRPMFVEMEEAEA